MDGFKSINPALNQVGLHIRRFDKKYPNDFLKSCSGQELEKCVLFPRKGYGRIADTPEDAIDIVSELTHDSNKLTLMINTMRQDRVDYSTHRLCIDLLNMLDHSSQQQEIYGRCHYMPSSFVKQ